MKSSELINKLIQREEALAMGDMTGFEEGWADSLRRLTHLAAYGELQTRLRGLYDSPEGVPFQVEDRDAPLSFMGLPSLREFEQMLQGLDKQAHEEGILSLDDELDSDDLPGFVRPVLRWCVDGTAIEYIHELCRVYFRSKKAEIDTLLDCLQLISDNLGSDGDFMASRQAIRGFGQYEDEYCRIADWLDNREDADFPKEGDHAFLSEWAGLMAQHRSDPPGMRCLCARLCGRVREEFALVCRMVWLAALSMTEYSRDDSAYEPLCFDYLPWSDDVSGDTGSRRQEIKRAYKAFEDASAEINGRVEQIFDLYTDLTLSVDSTDCTDEDGRKRRRAEKLAALASDMKEKQLRYSMKNAENRISFHQENRERINRRISELTGRESFLRDIE